MYRKGNATTTLGPVKLRVRCLEYIYISMKYEILFHHGRIVFGISYCPHTKLFDSAVLQCTYNTVKERKNAKACHIIY